MDKYAKLVESSTQSLTAATQALAMASQALAQAQAKSQASDKSLKNATSLHDQAKTARDQAQASLDSSRKALAAAREALKGPNAELEKAKRNFEASTQDVSRWQAELVNVERPSSSTTYVDSNRNLASSRTFSPKRRASETRPCRPFKWRASPFGWCPKDRPSGKVGPGQAGQSKSLETNKSAIVEAKEKKTAFIKNVDQLALVAKKEAEAKQDNSVLAQANAKFEETIALLKQDLSNTENQIASKQQELVAAENAVSVAQKGVETAMKLR